MLSLKVRIKIPSEIVLGKVFMDVKVIVEKFFDDFLIFLVGFGLFFDAGVHEAFDNFS